MPDNRELESASEPSGPTLPEDAVRQNMMNDAGYEFGGAAAALRRWATLPVDQGLALLVYDDEAAVWNRAREGDLEEALLAALWLLAEARWLHQILLESNKNIEGLLTSACSTERRRRAHT